MIHTSIIRSMIHTADVWPSGIGQVSPPIHPLASSQGAVFLINSCQKYFSCGPHKVGKPYSEVTAAFLPSSLGISHSFALVYSTWLPVSVYGTVLVYLSLETFLGSALYRIPLDESQGFATAWIPHLSECPDLPGTQSHGSDSNPIMSPIYSTPSFHRITQKLGNINPMSIGCGSLHLLRPD